MRRMEWSGYDIRFWKWFQEDSGEHRWLGMHIRNVCRKCKNKQNKWIKDRTAHYLIFSITSVKQQKSGSFWKELVSLWTPLQFSCICKMHFDKVLYQKCVKKLSIHGGSIACYHMRRRRIYTSVPQKRIHHFATFKT